MNHDRHRRRERHGLRRDDLGGPTSSTPAPAPTTSSSRPTAGGPHRRPLTVDMGGQTGDTLLVDDSPRPGRLDRRAHRHDADRARPCRGRRRADATVVSRRRATSASTVPAADGSARDEDRSDLTPTASRSPAVNAAAMSDLSMAFFGLHDINVAIHLRAPRRIPSTRSSSQGDRAGQDFPQLQWARAGSVADPATGPERAPGYGDATSARPATAADIQAPRSSTSSDSRRSPSPQPRREFMVTVGGDAMSARPEPAQGRRRCS